ncbi:Serine hydroxymethyltransferase 4, partial [Sarracenia purpurea var. burkii]
YIEKEMQRQNRSIEPVISENFTSFAIIEALSTALTNKYSEGLPGNCYYSNDEFIDEIENLFRICVLKAYHLNPTRWGINV